MPKPKNNSKSKSNSKSKDDSGESGSKVAVKGAQSLNIRHILCEKHSKKEEALTELRGGSPFNTVAYKFSEDKKEQSGLLGWKSKSDVVPVFWNAAYALPASTTTNPVYAEAKSEHGYHVIMVEGRK